MKSVFLLILLAQMIKQQQMIIVQDLVLQLQVEQPPQLIQLSLSGQMLFLQQVLDLLGMPLLMLVPLENIYVLLVVVLQTVIIVHQVPLTSILKLA